GCSLSQFGADAIRDDLEPRCPIFVVQRVARSHLLFVGAGVQVVAVDERHAEFLPQRLADRRLTRARYPHNDERRIAGLHVHPSVDAPLRLISSHEGSNKSDLLRSLSASVFSLPPLAKRGEGWERYPVSRRRPQERDT